MISNSLTNKSVIINIDNNNNCCIIIIIIIILLYHRNQILQFL
jgi:hypothetical protein